MKQKKNEKKHTDLKFKPAQKSEKGYDFLLCKMYFTGDDGYKKFLIFFPNAYFTNIGKQ